ncbi:transposase [Streptomyces sp. NPDC004074]|uniref:transposase n=1 Tax=Streptomyces sp. NPDC004074 TaxID=3154277 RepID=UPI0033A866F5
MALRPGRPRRPGRHRPTAGTCADQLTAEQVLLRYKRQGVVERRYHDFKGPSRSQPCSCRTFRSIAALITVICLALVVFCLIERQVRQALGPEQTIRGLCSKQPCRPPNRPHGVVPPRQPNDPARHRHPPHPPSTVLWLG